MSALMITIVGLYFICELSQIAAALAMPFACYYLFQNIKGFRVRSAGKQNKEMN